MDEENVENDSVPPRKGKQEKEASMGEDNLSKLELKVSMTYCQDI